MGYLGTKPNVATSLVDNIVTADKIAAGAVTDPKIAAMAASKLSGVIPDANAPSGSVIQMVTAEFSLDEATTSTSLVGSSLLASITPLATNSAIYYCFTFNYQPNGSAPAAGLVAVFRNNSVNLTQSSGALNQLVYSSNSGNVHHPLTIQGIDSPNTTSSTSYRIYHARLAGTGSTDSNIRSWGKAVVTLMEIRG